MRNTLSILLLLTALGSCGKQHLFVRNEYLDPSYLASCKIDTPDPRKCNPFCGQQLIVHWRFPASYKKCPDLHIVLYLHFRNLTSQEIVIPVRWRWGIYRYRLLNEDYWDCEGILTYRLEVRSGERVLESWTHQVWTNLIKLDDEAELCES